MKMIEGRAQWRKIPDLTLLPKTPKPLNIEKKLIKYNKLILYYVEIFKIWHSSKKCIYLLYIHHSIKGSSFLFTSGDCVSESGYSVKLDVSPGFPI
jgi:hypothetical protein